ncbi:MAG: hypothetical protein KKF52_01725 [Nanoarchaeota archaeon]|nr:hypothetical protein [Nanoarchaeota archaeon]MBU4241928.1 hypothetical protein [Nanoarchaeota archaeon]MBU4351899.1 hypothetical protein [Nanoarchaeota archaeon]MCG2719957.1 hypothetical protein [Nanoarchaeota archaeon]
MSFIKEIFEGKANDSIHYKFVRYGKGEYERLLFEITKSKNNFRVKSSFDFANDFIKIISENVKEDMDVKGKIIVNRDFEKELEEIGVEASSFKKRGKLYTAELNTTLTPKKLKEIYSKYNEHFLLLSINSNDFKLKTKGALPKPGGKIADNFCNATLPIEFINEFAWDVKEFTKLNIKHILKISEIIIPEELKNNPAKARIEGKRKGKIERILDIDGKEEKKEVDFEI